MSTNSRINGIEQIEAALRTLEAYGYCTLPLWTEHNDWLASSERSEPTEADYTWAKQGEAPSNIEDHLIQILKFPLYAKDAQRGEPPIGWREEKKYGFEVLSAANCFSNRQYTLSSGQRDILRSRHGMTPTKDVLIQDVALFKGTNLISQFTLCSTEHIDVRRRRHVLTEVVICPASAFFSQAAARDKEREAEQAEREEATDAKRVKAGKEPISTRAKAMQYFE